MIKNNKKSRIKGETVKALSLSALFLVLFFFNLNFISSEEFGYNYLEPGENLNAKTILNYTNVNVNNSNFWGGYSPTTYITDVLNNLYCKLFGCTMEGDIDMNGNDIYNIGYANTTGNVSIGGQVIVTGDTDKNSLGYKNVRLGIESNTPRIIFDNGSEVGKIDFIAGHLRFIINSTEALGINTYRAIMRINSTAVRIGETLNPADLVVMGSGNFTEDVYADTYFGDGSELTGISAMDYTNVALTNISNNFGGEEGTTRMVRFNNKEIPFNKSGKGIDVGSYSRPTNPSTGTYDGIGGFNVVGGYNYSDGAKVNALAFGNVALTEAYRGLGVGGNESLNVVGLNVYGADGISYWASGIDGIFTMRDVYGIDLISARGQSRIYGNIYNTMLRASTTTEAVDGNETILTLEKPTKGVNNWQMILEGTGVGTGIWFGGREGERIYNNGSDIIMPGGFTGSCSNANYVGGIAVSCND